MYSKLTVAIAICAKSCIVCPENLLGREGSNDPLSLPDSVHFILSLHVQKVTTSNLLKIGHRAFFALSQN